jgi:hypothetical protein
MNLLTLENHNHYIPFTTESPALQGEDGFNSFQVFVFGKALWLLAVRVC